jgi:predicted TIM-barrel fold metal-dependent hydrolase
MKPAIKTAIVLILTSTQSYAQVEENVLPIIDMHLHALPSNFMGPAPLAFCLPTTQWPVKEVDKPYKETFIEWEKDPTTIDPDCSNPIWSPKSGEEIMLRTFEIMDKRNVIGVTSGPLTKKYQEAKPDRIIPGLMFNMMFSNISIDSLRTLFESGEYKVFGEITNQYSGIGPNNERFQAYLEVAEELNIPVGIHMGPGPPGIAYVNSPHYRGKLHDPLLLEETLLKFPDLRIYICHAGWPMIDNLLALLWTHPQVYVDIGIIVYALPPKEFNKYLQRIVEAGFGNRVMFGSDQMVWPETLEVSIRTIENADYLSEQQKRNIFYNNAARFLNLSEETIAKHHKIN